MNGIDLGGRKLVAEWADVYYEQFGVRLNNATLRKRRLVCGLGTHIPPHAWYLTWDEFIEVVATPLPQCKNVYIK